MKRLRNFLAFFLVFVLASCGGETPSPVVAPAPTVEGLPDDPEEVVADVLPEYSEPIENTADMQSEAVTVALMLPLSGPDAEASKALMRAATMALFDAYDPRIKILPLDTQSDPAIAEQKAEEAVAAGVSVVLGPLLSSNVRAVGEKLKGTGIPIVGFSNDSTVAAEGRFVIGFLPEAEVKRVVDHAVGAGLVNFGALVPMGRYGDRIRTAFGDTATVAGIEVSAMESYPPDADALFEPVKRLAKYDERRDDVRREVRFLRALRDDVTDEIAEKLEEAEVMEGVEFDAVLVPEGGALMRTLAPLLPFYEIDPNRVKLLGTGLWNDEGLLGEPPLQGAWFAAPNPTAPNAFLDRYEGLYGERAPRIATLAYDAMSLVASLAKQPVTESGVSDGEGEDRPTPFEGAVDTRFAVERFLAPEGFMGVDGLFRLLPDGTSERALAILEVNRRGFRVVDPAPDSFPSFGYALKN